MEAQLQAKEEELHAVQSEIGSLSDRIRELRAVESGLQNDIITIKQQVGTYSSGARDC